ncbi:MAG: Flp family type IVb pilin [Pirellulaceae bacterium]|nr:Flp family type IVb pilin [Pirellulaceae bacterium]
MFKRPLRKPILDFLREEDGPTAVEYAVLLALIVAVCVGSVQFLAVQTKASFDESGDAIAGAFN